MTKRNFRVWGLAGTLALTAVSGFAQETSHISVAVKDLKDLDTFTHVARIPAGSDISSLKFHGLKLVTIPTRNTLTADARYCGGVARRDPGGSMFCPLVEAGSYERAYEVTYSFEGSPLASDEQGNTSFTFRVYFRPEELGPAERKALFEGKGHRADVAGSFRVTTSRNLEARMVVDEANSTRCAGSYTDGLWMRSDSKCTENLKYKPIMAPSDYITVRIDLAPTREAASAALHN